MKRPPVSRKYHNYNHTYYLQMCHQKHLSKWLPNPHLLWPESKVNRLIDTCEMHKGNYKDKDQQENDAEKKEGQTSLIHVNILFTCNPSDAEMEWNVWSLLAWWFWPLLDVWWNCSAKWWSIESGLLLAATCWWCGWWWSSVAVACKCDTVELLLVLLPCSLSMTQLPLALKNCQ